MIHSTTNFSKIFTTNQLALLDMAFIKRMRRRPDVSRRFFKYAKMDKEFMRFFVPTGVGLPERLDTELSAVNTDSMLQGPHVDVTTTDYGIAVEFTHKFRREDKRNLMEDIIADMGDSVNYHRRLMPSEMLSRAFDSTKTIRDGKSLCATDHSLYGGKVLGSQTASNRMSASALTQSAIELMITQGIGVVNEMGFLKQVDYKTLPLDRASWARGFEILKSPTRSDTASRAINVLQYAEGGLPTPVLYDMLDLNVGFFLMSDAADSKSCVWDREGPYRSSWMDHARRIQTIALFYSRAIDSVDWRHIIGTPFN